MPIYEYHCAACTKIGEYLQKIADPAPATCRFCGDGPLQKKVSQSAFVLKGGGWYVTDFRDGGKKKPASSSEPTAEGASDQKSTASTDSSDKPATETSDSATKTEVKKEAKTDNAKASSASTD